jgi:hypothetical protein
MISCIFRVTSVSRYTKGSQSDTVRNLMPGNSLITLLANVTFLHMKIQELPHMISIPFELVCHPLSL